MALTTKDKTLCAVYIVIAIVALVATQVHNIAFFSQPDNGGVLGFIKSLYVNHPAAFIANDIALFGLAAFVLMIQEAKQWGIPYVWLYIVFSLVISISVTFPLFLVARQAAIAKTRPVQT